MSISLPVVFTSDRRYLPHFAAAMVSFLENNPGNNEVFLVSDEIVEGDLVELRQIVAERYASSLVLVSIEDEVLDGFSVSGHIAPIAYARLLLADILPRTIERVLYLDSDLIVVGNIVEPLERVWGTALSGSPTETSAPLFAVKESDGRHLHKLGFSSGEYFNSGVMLINLEEWRRQNYSARLVEAAHRERSEILWWDQDVLNLFFERRWAPLDSTFNKMIGHHHEPGLVFHFNSQEKPWVAGYRYDSASLYQEYRDKTPFVPFTPQFSLKGWLSRRAPNWLRSFVKLVRRKFSI